jgi:hypothetical protein
MLPRWPRWRGLGFAASSLTARSGAYMADGYARRTRCRRMRHLFGSGPSGPPNLGAGCGDAYMACTGGDRVRGGVTAGVALQDTYQEIEDFPMCGGWKRSHEQAEKLPCGMLWSASPTCCGRAFRARRARRGPGAIWRWPGSRADPRGERAHPLWEERFMKVPAFRPEPSPMRCAPCTALARPNGGHPCRGGGA